MYARSVYREDRFDFPRRFCLHGIHSGLGHHARPRRPLIPDIHHPLRIIELLGKLGGSWHMP